MAFLLGKVGAKILGLHPVVGRFRSESKERWYYTLLMSTGLTFGTISSLFGLTHGIVSQDQYSHVVAVVIASTLVPTLIANARFLPRHLMPTREPSVQRAVKAARATASNGAPDEPLEEG